MDENILFDIFSFVPPANNNDTELSILCLIMVLVIDVFGVTHFRVFGVTHFRVFGVTHFCVFGVTHFCVFGVTHFCVFRVTLDYKQRPCLNDIVCKRLALFCFCL